MKRIDFENGTITSNILNAALPMLVAQLFSGGEVLGREVLQVKDHLQRPLPVAQVDKNDAAHVPLGLYPTGGGDGASNIFLPERTAVIGSHHNSIHSFPFSGFSIYSAETQENKKPFVPN